MNLITSRDNPLIKALRRLIQDSTGYRKAGQFWLEGDHLCRAAVERGVLPLHAVMTESFWAEQGAQWGHLSDQVILMPDALFSSLSGLESPARMGFVVALPAQSALLSDASTVVLDRLQDAGNVGAILRCASAFGYRQVLAIKGTAALWSPKVLRAGMGAHFGLHLVESVSQSDVSLLQVPVLTTSSHEGPFLHELLRRGDLPSRCAWVFGHEGQGVSASLMALSQQKVRIAQPGGEESLNVATAAAICLHASSTAVI
ncbi:rRNA methyltransferase [Limnohabitans sp. 2KL-1]|jgi:TrmH family RNA methyltransferase|uniref:TrmH family RNA methyltransferase n=1 Tax=Limnohabitans sp. 2KL-1 TaxID=1100699 RepID=UPI000D392AD9|nr:RNA methyltransferase [Limnohabitans sp. 2KL-1]PUE47042.1 rRNA methyltransferase [Limnohabitans sp. 2KL-1]